MTQGILITGTDTEIGKTVVSCTLLEKFKQQGKKVQGMKPVASGCEVTRDGLRNEDAELLIKHSSQAADYDNVNPYSFEPAIAPHVAAMQAGVDIDFDVIHQHYSQLAQDNDLVIVEGVGGWQVPLNQKQTLADLAVSLDLPIVLVAGIRLGAINHTLLSYQAICQAGLTCIGWVANIVDTEMQNTDETISAIKERVAAPLLGVLPRQEVVDIEQLAACLDLP